MYLERTHLKLLFDIRSIVTMFYFEFDKDYRFNGERHDFWEMVYVDKGEIEVGADGRRCRLEQGSLIFHKPDEFHSLSAIQGKASNVIVISFDCRSSAMERLENRAFTLDREQCNALARILHEAAGAFELPFHYPLIRSPDQPIGSEQLVKNYLESFLILLLRGDSSSERERTPMLPKEREEARLVAMIISLMEERLSSQLSLVEISRTLHMASTTLKEQFKRHTGKAVMEYYAHMKLEKAKLLIREDVHNFTEISRQLGFSSVHYFSKAFKRSTGMSPSEYARSVMARSRIERHY